MYPMALSNVGENWKVKIVPDQLLISKTEYLHLQKYDKNNNSTVDSYSLSN